MSDGREVPSFARDPGPWEALMDDGGSSCECVYVVASSAAEAVASAERARPRFAVLRITRLHREIAATDLQYTWEDLKRDLDTMLRREIERRTQVAP